MNDRIPTLGGKVKALRRSKGWTQKRLARVAEVALRVVQFIERGDGASSESLDRVARAFGLQAEVLINGSRLRGDAPDSGGSGEIGPSSFVAGPVIRHPRQFFGRERELRRLFPLWRGNPLQCAAIIGPPRSGKSSLLRYVEAITTTPSGQLRDGQRSDWLPRPDRYRWVFADFHDPRLKSQEGVLRHLLEGLGLTVPIPCDQDRFSEVMGQGLDNPTIVLMDGIESALCCPDLDEPFWDGLRSLASNQARGNLAYLLTSSESAERLADRFRAFRSPFFNIFGCNLPLGPLAVAEARELIGSSPIPFPPADVEWIVDQSGRWPILVQLLCRERLVALEAGEASDAWRREGLEQIDTFRYLLAAP